MDTLQEQLDRSFGDGPPLPPADSRVMAGRRALRRRRTVSSVTAVAAAAVLFAGGYAVSSGSDPVRGQATDSATARNPEPTEDPNAEPTDVHWSRGELIRFVDEKLVVRPGVIVHERIRNPYGWAPPKLSDALDVTWRGQRQWLMIEKRPLPIGISSSSSTPSNGWASFADYVTDRVGPRPQPHRRSAARPRIRPARSDDGRGGRVCRR